MAAMAKRRIPGWYRLLRLFGERRPALLTTRTKHGVLLSLEPESHIDGNIIRTGYYELPVLESILERLHEGATFWDVGANIGVHSLTVRHLRKDVTVCSFEPSPEVFASLSRNCALNNSDLRLAAVALSDKSGFANFSISGRYNQGLGSLTPWSDATYTTVLHTRCERAADLIATGIPAPDVVKIDVEGAELLVLQGFGDAIRNVRTVIFEAELPLEGTDRGRAIKELLEKAGFSISKMPKTRADDPDNLVADRV